MSYENLMSHLGFSTNLQNYTASIAFRDTGDASSSKRLEDDKKFTDFMDSLKESNDSWESKKTSDRNEIADKKEAPPSSTDVKEKPDTDAPSDAGKTVESHENDGADVVADKTETTAETGGAQTKEDPVQEASTGDAAPINTDNDESVETVSAPAIPIQAIVVNPDQSIQITLANAIGSNESIEVKTISPEEVSNILAGLSDKLAALINDALSGLANETGTGEVQSTNVGITDFGVSMVQSSGEGEVDTQQAVSLLELLSALIGQIGEDSTVVSENPAIQSVISRLQNGEEIDLATVLSSLSPEEVTELKDQISAYLTGELSVEEQKELIGLLAQHYPTALPITPQTTITPNVVAKLGGAEAIGDAPKTGGAPQVNTTPDAKPIGALTQDVASNAQTKAAPSETMTAPSGEKIAAPTQSEGEAVTTTMNGVNSDDTIQGRTDNSGPTQKDAPVAGGAAERFLQTNNSNQSAVAVEADAALTQNALGISSLVQAQSSAVGSLSNAAGQAISTGSTHPATQLVSMTMQKAIKNGEETTIKLKLDPPELGRVDVKMSIDQDSTTKIVLTVEKPETHMMLQRDAQFLERAMSDAGLDVGDNLSFELAEDGQAFDKGDSSGDQANLGGNSGTEVENALITQNSTMDWTIDPNTGRMHYSILA